jgi:hypothetical protein
MKIQNLRFQKYDRYGHPIFIASKTELENYTTLQNLAERLREKQYDTFLPIYNSIEFNYSSIRFMKNQKFANLIPSAKYDIDYKITTIIRNDKTHVNCFASVMRMVENAPILDEGEELIL